MKYTVGYQVNSDDDYMEYIANNKEHIYEMYFSWGDMPNGRNSMLLNSNLSPWQAQEKQINDLKYISNRGIKLNLLLNANCYGKDSQSKNFYIKIGQLIDYLGAEYGLSSITTTSPLIAKFVHDNFENLDVRASVNMKIGSIPAMEYVIDYFDSFYLQRELNRNIKKIKEIKSWCDKNNKGLYMLANSGCLNDCSAHTFHDNLVAHENEIASMDNGYNFEGICREHLKNKRISLIQNTNFVRPEDIHLYDDYFIAAKLATRVSKNPINILKAYINQTYSGSITSLLEPNHTALFYPDVIENKKIPADFGAKVMNCDKNCSDCNYCSKVLTGATVTLTQ